MTARIRRLILAAATLSLFPACAHSSNSAPKSQSDWERRIGHYDLDQAVEDLGPPTAVKDLPDGGRVCTWPRKGNEAAATFNPPATSYGTTTTGVQQDDVLILTFDERKVLINCVSPSDPPPAK